MRKSFMKILLLSLASLLMIFIGELRAEDQLDGNYKNMEQMMGAIKLEKKQVESMVDKMVSSGRISAEDGQKAKREIASMKDEDLENLKVQAIAEVKNKKLLDK